jgi:hypothetical protein
LARGVRVVMPDPESAMKNTLLIIATFAGLASIASAASNDSDTPAYVLPTYVVTAPRHADAEQRIADRLKEFRAEARHNAIVAPSPAMPKVRTAVAENAAKVPLTKVAKS